MKYLTTPLENIPWIRHGFFTRLGGQSSGIYGSLNCGFGSADDFENVKNNRALVAESLSIIPEKLITLYQTHSTTAIVAKEPWSEKAPEGDALVTSTAGLAVGILTADCAPVLFADKKRKIVAAAHAGWRGAIGGILESAIEKMTEQGSQREDICAAIGPCIGPKSYEVREDFRAPFLEQNKEHENFFMPAEKSGHLMFNLPGYVASQLYAAGIHEVHDVAQDTLADENHYYSYRRTTLRGDKDYGRQISVIAIAAG